MPTEHWQRVERLFAEAQEQPPPMRLRLFDQHPKLLRRVSVQLLRITEIQNHNRSLGRQRRPPPLQIRQPLHGL